MKNKGLLVAVLAAVAIIAFMVLPLATLTYGGETAMSLKGINYITGSVDVSIMGFNQAVPIKLEIDVILIIVAAVLAIIAGVKNSKKLAITGSIIGFLVVLLNVANASSELGDMGMGMEASVGIGMWISLICFAGAVAMSFLMSKPVVEEVPTFTTDFNNQQ